MAHLRRGRLPTPDRTDSADDARGHRRWPAQRKENLSDVSHRVTATLRIELERHHIRDLDAARPDGLERRAQRFDSLLGDVVVITQRRGSHPVRRRHGPNRKGWQPYVDE